MYSGHGHPYLVVGVVVTVHMVRVPEGKDWAVMEEVSAHTPTCSERLMLESSLGAAAVVAVLKAPYRTINRPQSPI